MSLLDEIRAGKALRKVPDSEKRDRSTLDAVKKVTDQPGPPAAAPTNSDYGRPSGPTPTPSGGPMGLGDLFANGMPKLRSTSSRASAAEPSPYSRPTAPKPTSPKPSNPPPPSSRPPGLRTSGPPPPPPARGPLVPAPPVPSAPIHRPSYGSAAPAPFRPAPSPIVNGSPAHRPSVGSTWRPQSRPQTASSGYSSASTKPQAPMPPGPPARGILSAQSADRPNTGSGRSQRVGLPSSDDNTPRPINAKPKVIRVSARTSGPPPSQPDGGRSHPPPPPPPPASSGGATVSPTSSGVAALSIEFERRFRFLDESRLPPPPLPYRGPRTYGSKQSRTAARPTAEAANGPVYQY